MNFYRLYYFDPITNETCLIFENINTVLTENALHYHQNFYQRSAYSGQILQVEEMSFIDVSSIVQLKKKWKHVVVLE